MNLWILLSAIIFEKKCLKSFKSWPAYFNQFKRTVGGTEEHFFPRSRLQSFLKSRRQTRQHIAKSLFDSTRHILELSVRQNAIVLLSSGAQCNAAVGYIIHCSEHSYIFFNFFLNNAPCTPKIRCCATRFLFSHALISIRYVMYHTLFSFVRSRRAKPCNAPNSCIFVRFRRVTLCNAPVSFLL